MNQEIKAIFEKAVQKRMRAPFCMSREQAEMTVAVLMWHPESSHNAIDSHIAFIEAMKYPVDADHLSS